MDWNHWCRLCGKENGNQINIFIKSENSSNLAEVVLRFFSIEIINTTDGFNFICSSCNDYLLTLENYYKKIIKVQQLYAEIESKCKVGLQIDVNRLRLKYNLHTPSPLSECDFETIEKIKNDNLEESNIYFENININDPCETFDCAVTNNCEQSRVKSEDKYLEEHAENQKFSKIRNSNLNSKEICNSHQYPKNKEKNKIELYKFSTVKFKNEDLEKLHSDEEKLIMNEVEENMEIKNRKRIYKTGEKKYECEECHQKFSRESNYVYHMKKSHKGLPPCEFCGKICKTKQKLRLHLQLHLPPEEREKLLFKCPHCDKKFTQSAKVKEHVRAIHLQEKPFVCEQCGKNFASQSNLCSHKRTHDTKSRLNCNLCPKIFNNPHKLRFHIKHTHNSTGHPCSVCNQVLKTRKTLRNHMLIHSDAKPYKCNYCGKDFKRDKNFQIHMIAHSGLKPFACRFCTQSYANRSNCKKHEKHHHQKEYEAAAAIVDKEPQQLIQMKLPNIAQLEAMLEQMKAEREINSS